MQTTWVVAADTKRVRIFEMADAEHLREIEDLANPSTYANSHEPDEEALSGADDVRVFQAQHKVNEDVPGQDPDLLSREAGDFLNQACHEHRYEKLRLLAAPGFLENIRCNLNAEVRQRVEDEIVKDMSWFDTRAIEDYLKHH